MSEVSGPNMTLTRVASGALPQYRFVRQIGNKDVVLCGSGQIVLGVVQNAPLDNDHATVAFGGVTKIQLSMSLGAAAPVMADANGFAQNATAIVGVGSGSIGTVAGVLLQSATSGSIAEMLISRF